MRYLRHSTTIYEAQAGASIEHAIAEAITMAAFGRTTITFVHNGVTVDARSDSSPQLLLRDWQ